MQKMIKKRIKCSCHPDINCEECKDYDMRNNLCKCPWRAANECPLEYPYPRNKPLFKRKKLKLTDFQLDNMFK